MERLVTKNLPKGMGYEWTGIARQQVQAARKRSPSSPWACFSSSSILVAQYESLTTPFVIMLAVPLALFGAIGAIYIRRWCDLLTIIVHSKLAGHLVALPTTSCGHLRANRLRHADRPCGEERDPHRRVREPASPSKGAKLSRQ